MPSSQPTTYTMSVGPSLHLLSSTLGQILSGRAPSATDVEYSFSMLTLNSISSTHTGRRQLAKAEPDFPMVVAKAVQQLWALQLDTLGIKDGLTVFDNHIALMNFHHSIQHADGRYQVRLPWKEHQDALPENSGLATGRMRHLVKRFPQHTMEAYNKLISGQLQKGIIEQATVESSTTAPVHYLPHRCVERPGKSTPLRIVYDASPKFGRQHLSLNEAL